MHACCYTESLMGNEWLVACPQLNNSCKHLVIHDIEKELFRE